MHPQATLGLEAWLQWLGKPLDQAKKMQSREAELRALADALFLPPSEDEIERLPYHGRAGADRICQKLARDLGISPVDFWPQSAPYAICVTHDIDRVLSTVHRMRNRVITAAMRDVFADIRSAIDRRAWERNPFFNFKRLSLMEREWAIPSACYVLFERRRWQYAIQRREPQHVIGVYSPQDILPELSELRSEGKEIGLHASFDSWEDLSALERDLRALRASGLEVSGVRSHYLRFDPRTSPQHFRSAGLSYDSSIGFNYGAGFRAGTCFPYQWNGLLEIPFHLMDSALRWQASRGADPGALAMSVLDEVRRQGGLLVLNWHLHVMNSAAFPREVALLDALIARGKKDGAWFTRPVDIAEWWRKRARAVDLGPPQAAGVRR